MKKTIPMLLCCLLLALCPLRAQEKHSLKDLDPRFQKWLEEDVVYIITAKEKDVFLRLGTDKERDIFTEAFWKQRDPTPGTPQNEFKDEHYRRLAEANRIYGRGTPRPGWRTDKGRIFIILGPPDDVERFEGESFVYPTEIWTFKGDQRYGLPAYFQVVFFKEKGAGEFKLYSPMQDGMESLIIDKKIAGGSPENAYYELFRYDPELAKAALSLIPEENPPPESPSISSDILLANVISLPQKKVNDEYAAKLLAYKDVVEVDYTANYIPSDHLLSVIRDERGVSFVHYSLEPSSLSVDSYEDKYVAHFEVNVKVSDTEGRTVFQYGKSFPLELNEENLQQLKNSRYALQDSFPLIPGTYTLDVILKNTVSKEFTSFDQTLQIPGAEGVPALSTLLLGYKVEKNPNWLIQKKPFVVLGQQVKAQSNRLFAKQDRLAVFFQATNLSPDLLRDGSVRYVLADETKEWARETERLAELEDRTNFLREFPLDNLPPGFHRVRVSICDGRDQEVLFEEKEFQVISSSAIARPWILSKLTPLSQQTQTEFDFILANQHWTQGHLPQAGELLEKCHRQMPQLRYAQRLAEFLLQERDYQRVKDVLSPFLGTTQEQFLWLALLGRAEQALGEFPSAAAHYRDYLVRSGTNIEVLNALGECHVRLGDTEQALTAWGKSLELNPNQPELKKKVEGLKNK